MKTVLLIGLGRFGKHIAIKLSELNHEVMAVDKHEERANEVLPYVTNVQIGDATNQSFLASLGIGNFDVCIVAIGDDFQASLEVTTILKDLGAKKVISRASRGLQEKFLLRNGADEVVYPEKQMAAWTAIRATSDYVLDYMFIEESFSLFELSVPEDWIGKTISQLDVRRKNGINIVGIRKNGNLSLNVSPDYLLHEEETLLVIGDAKALQKCVSGRGTSNKKRWK